MILAERLLFDMQDKRIRILLCCNTSFGLANFRAGLITSLQAHGYQVIAVAPRDERTDALVALGVEYHEWRLSARSANVFSEWASLRDLARIYRASRPDFCLHYTVKPVIYGAIACSRQKIRFASVITGLGYAFLNEGLVPRLIRWFYARLLRRSERNWFLNRDDHDLFVRNALAPSESASIMPGEGIDTDHFAPRAERRLNGEGSVVRFLVVSRLLFDKGLVEFAEACKLLRERGVVFEAAVVGGAGSENPSAIPKSQIDRWVAERRFDYLGSVTDVRPMLDEADCVVLPSYREGLPRALLEASSMELPIVATDVPGCRDVVRNEETGLLCVAKDAQALADAMARICAMTPEQRRNMGRQGRRHVRSIFGMEEVNRIYLDFIEERVPGG